VGLVDHVRPRTPVSQRPPAILAADTVAVQLPICLSALDPLEYCRRYLQQSIHAVHHRVPTAGCLGVDAKVILTPHFV
jgi:hypothetical protein